MNTMSSDVAAGESAGAGNTESGAFFQDAANMQGSVSTHPTSIQIEESSDEEDGGGDYCRCR